MSLQNKNINFFKNKSYWPQTFELYFIYTSSNGRLPTKLVYISNSVFPCYTLSRAHTLAGLQWCRLGVRIEVWVASLDFTPQCGFCLILSEEPNSHPFRQHTGAKSLVTELSDTTQTVSRWTQHLNRTLTIQSVNSLDWNASRTNWNWNQNTARFEGMVTFWTFCHIYSLMLSLLLKVYIWKKTTSQ